MRLFCISFLVISFMFIGATYAEIEPGTAMGIWLFEEGSDAAMDYSGQGNDGTPMEGPESVNGKFGKALNFDGVDDYVLVPTSGSLDSCNENYTGLMWVKIAKKDVAVLGGCCNDDHALLNFSYNCLLNIFGPGRGDGHGKVEIGSGNINPSWVSGATLVNDGEWHHLAFTYDGEVKKLYIDGNVDAEQPTTGLLGLTGGDLMIGGMPGPERPGGGIIDDVAVFNVALTDDDVNNIMDNGLVSVIGLTAVSPASKLAATWASIKVQH